MAIADRPDQDVGAAIDTVGASLSATVVNLTAKSAAPSLRIESAEGITTYSGLNGDDESARARGWLDRRLGEIKDRHASLAPPPGDAPTNGAHRTV